MIKVCTLRYRWVGSFIETANLPTTGTPFFTHVSVDELNISNSVTTPPWSGQAGGLSICCPELVGDVITYSNGDLSTIIGSAQNVSGDFTVYQPCPTFVCRSPKKIQGKIHFQILNLDGSPFSVPPHAADNFYVTISLYVK